MKLNLEILQHHLSQRHQTVCLYPDSQGLTLQRPKLFLSGDILRKDQFYLISSADLPGVPPTHCSPLICVGQKLPQAWYQPDLPILLITDDINILALLNEILSIFDMYDQWDTAIREELTKDSDFSILKILNLGTDMLQLPFYVINASLQMVFTSETVSRSGNGFQIEVHNANIPLDIEGCESIKEACRVERIIKEPYLSSRDWNSNQLYCFNVYMSEHFTCCAWFVESTHAFQKKDFYLADYFFGHFERAFHKYLRVLNQQESPEGSALYKLLKKIPLSSQEQKQFCLDPKQVFVLFGLKESKTANPMPIDYMCSMLNTLLPNSVFSTILDSSIYGLIKLQHGKNGIENSLYKLLEDLIDRMGYQCGISNDFSDITNMSPYMEQVKYLTAQCITERTSSVLFFFQDYVLDFVLFHSSQHIAPETLYSNGIQSLFRYDKERNKEYAYTLRTLLDNEMNISKTAELLFIHRTSLIKRIDKIERVLDLDLNDPKVRLYLRLCLYIQERETQNLI